jgi:hypothetical protein
MTHRDELFDLTLRWLNDDLRAGDGELVTRIFFYEGIISAAVAVNRMIAFIGRLFGGRLSFERVRQKRLLRERIIEYMPQADDAGRGLAERFRLDPDSFFPHVPIDALLIIYGPALAAVGRIKRLSRVAEKVSYRLVDVLFREIKTEAERIAGHRAAHAGLSLPALVSSKEDMLRDFVEAEALVVRQFRNRNVVIGRDALSINDMIGFKIIGGHDLFEKAASLLRKEPGISIAKVQEHTGIYRDIKLLVDIELPAPDEIIKHIGSFDWSIAALRGLDPDRARMGFQSYLEHGSRTIRVEIILTSYEELMQSEFGRSMHELRVLRKRGRQAYCGVIAHNAGYLIEYLLALAQAPVVEIAELPIKMYGRYLPESIVAAKNALFGRETEDSLVDAYCLQQKTQSDE